MRSALKYISLVLAILALLMVAILTFNPRHKADAFPPVTYHPPLATIAPARTLTSSTGNTGSKGSTGVNHPPAAPIIPTRTLTPGKGNTGGKGNIDAFANGPYTVKGNTVLDAGGQPYLFHGIGRDSLEYSCWGDGHLDAQELSYMGAGTNHYAATYWGANTVRLPLSEGIWLNGQSSQSCSAAQYQALVKQTVDALTGLKLNVILDLQWSDAGGQSTQAGGPWAAPDADSVTFWQQVASIYKSYSNVLFELFNEPHPASWTCWLSACTISDTNYSQDCNCTKSVTFSGVGMQALVNAVRGTGATNLLLVAGMDWGYDLSQIAAYPIQGTNIIYDTHPYPYAEKMPGTWDAAFGKISATYPVISAESGQYDCGTSFMSQLLAYFDAHKISWVAWAWVVQGSQCGYPLLIQDYRGTPVPGMGQLIYMHLRSYLL